MKLVVNGDVVVAESATVPENPFNGAIVTVEVPCPPVGTVMLVGEALTVKSGIVTVYVTVVLWVNVPLVPVTVIVYVPAVCR